MQERHKIFAERLRLARRRKKVSQAAIAQACGVSVKTVKRWEAGEAIPTWKTARKLVLFLQVSGWWLAGLSDNTTFFHNNSPDESRLLVAYRRLDIRGRRAILAMIEESYGALKAAKGNRQAAVDLEDED